MVSREKRIYKSNLVVASLAPRVIIAPPCPCNYSSPLPAHFTGGWIVVELLAHGQIATHVSNAQIAPRRK